MPWKSLEAVPRSLSPAVEPQTAHPETAPLELPAYSVRNIWLVQVRKGLYNSDGANRQGR